MKACVGTTIEQSMAAVCNLYRTGMPRHQAQLQPWHVLQCCYQFLLCQLDREVTQQAEPQTEPKAAKTDPAAEDDVMFKVDLEARKAGLRAQLAAFTKVLSKSRPCTRFNVRQACTTSGRHQVKSFKAQSHACSSKITQHRLSSS